MTWSIREFLLSTRSRGFRRFRERPEHLMPQEISSVKRQPVVTSIKEPVQRIFFFTRAWNPEWFGSLPVAVAHRLRSGSRRSERIETWCFRTDARLTCAPSPCISCYTSCCIGTFARLRNCAITRKTPVETVFVENARLEGCASYLRPAVSWKTLIMFETLHKRAAKLDHRAFLFTFSLAELLDYWNRNKAWLFVSQVSGPRERVRPFQFLLPIFYYLAGNKIGNKHAAAGFHLS